MTNESAIPRHSKWYLQLKLFHSLQHSLPALEQGEPGLAEPPEPLQWGQCSVTQGTPWRGSPGAFQSPGSCSSVLWLSSPHRCSPCPKQCWVSVPWVQQCFTLCGVTDTSIKGKCLPNLKSQMCLPVPPAFLRKELSQFLFSSWCGPTFCGVDEAVPKCLFIKSSSLIVLVQEDSEWERQRSSSVG